MESYQPIIPPNLMEEYVNCYNNFHHDPNDLTEIAHKIWAICNPNFYDFLVDSQQILRRNQLDDTIIIYIIHHPPDFITETKDTYHLRPKDADGFPETDGFFGYSPSQITETLTKH